MINIAICDDEMYISDKIKSMAVNFFAGKKMEIAISQFTSGEELLRCDKSIDILFLDIQMSGMDGMETARKLRSQNYTGYLIFITVLKEMVFHSFEVQAYDYLVKPIERECFEKTMERLMTSMQTSSEAKLLVQKGYEYSFISFADIIYCEIINRKIYLYLKSGEIIDYYDKMDNLEAKLDGRFFKCHRSYFINLNYLQSYKNGTAIMSDGSRIPVSRLRSKEFTNVILHYMKEWRL